MAADLKNVSTSNINSTWVNRVISENRSLSPQRIRVRAGAGELNGAVGEAVTF